MSEDKKKGIFIVIDGTDGSGKATQTERLVQKLKAEGHEVEIGDFPQYGHRSCTMVEDYLNGEFGTADDVSAKQASIFYAVDRYAASFEIRKWLNEGKIVIGNRYASSNMGHQAGKILDLNQRNEFLDWLDELEFEIFKIPRPDLTLLLFVPPEINVKLVEKKGTREYQEEGEVHDIHTKNAKHMADASNAYKYVADKYQWPVIECVKDEELMSIEEIHEKVWNQVRNLF